MQSTASRVFPLSWADTLKITKESAQDKEEGLHFCRFLECFLATSPCALQKYYTNLEGNHLSVRRFCRKIYGKGRRNHSPHPIPPSTWQKLRWGRSLKRAAQSREWVSSLPKEVLFSLYCHFQQQNHCASSQLFPIHWFRLKSLSQAFSIFSHIYWQRRKRSFQTAHPALFSNTLQRHICPLRPLLLNFPVTVCNLKMLWTDFDEDENCNLKPIYFKNIISLVFSLSWWTSATEESLCLAVVPPTTVLAALVVAVVYL